MRSWFVFVLVLAAGFAAGFVSNHYFSAGLLTSLPVKVESLDASPKTQLIQNITTDPKDNTDNPLLNSSQPHNAVASDDSTAQALLTIQEQLQTEQIERQQLEKQLTALQNSVENLELRLQSSEVTGEATSDNGRRVRSNRIEAEQLINAGFGVDQATDIVRRWNQRELDFLYTRDKATRENWLDTDRYREEIATLRNIDDTFQTELGDKDYDRFLFAMGRENRLQIETVLDNSAASTLGLEPGDRILQYDDKRVYSIRQLNNETSKGVAEQPVSLIVERGSNQVQLYIPRGPIGVSLVGVSVKPVG